MSLTIADKDTDFRAASRTLGDLLSTKYVFRVVEITFDTSYPRGGESLSAANKTAIGIDSALLFVGSDNSDRNLVPSFDYTNQKIKLFTGIAGGSSQFVEVGEGIDVSDVKVRAWIIGLPE